MNINDVLTRGVEQILPSKRELAETMKKRKIKLYLGIDPTGSRLHLGHAIALRKLQEFADLGHEAILLFGTGTVLAGDPSQREEAREKIAAVQIKHNISTWKDQVKNIVDFNKVNIMYNGEWLLRLALEDIIEIASHISAVQLIKRDMFQKRLERGDAIWTHEILYPLLQGYDSVAMNVDLEIGGTDQTFNMLIGRELQQKMNRHEKFVLSVPMINGLDGRPMSKTSNNCIWLMDSPNDMFGKIMSLSDSQIIPYLTLLTKLPIPKTLDDPLKAKKRLSFEIVKTYHSENEANKAQEAFESTFQDMKVPDDAPVLMVNEKSLLLLDLVFATKKISSRSEAKRLIFQKAIELDGRVAKNPLEEIVIPKKGIIIKIGKKIYLKVHQG